ncbi:hypothetical protein CKO36_18730 [Rhabdochromatium marinum]|nr:hypothetical protein [Rhabdochromatium marinum]
MLLGYLPKLSLVLLIELFAFFFLKLYRYSLMEVKYFQNEITSCEIKMMGLVASIDSELKASVVDHFIAVERNFILKKDERTIDLAREEIEASTVKNFVDKIASLKASK